MSTNPVEPFKVTIYNKSLVRIGLLSNPIDMTVVPRDNMKGTARFTLGLDHPQLEKLAMTDGVRVTCDYMGKQVLSGPIVSRELSGPSISGIAAFGVEDDFRILHEVLAWPVPTSPITNQTARTAHVLTGPVETVVKDLIRANVTRLGLNVTVAASQGRGPRVTLEARMEFLYDVIIDKLNQAGLSLTVKQSGASIVVDVRTPKTYPLVLSDESGIVQSWSWTNKAPTATRAVVGGVGDDELRDFRLFTDTAAENTWGMKSEAFVNASDVGSDYAQLLRDIERAEPGAERDALIAQRAAAKANYETLMAAAGAESLVDTGEKVGLRMSLSETENFRYGQTVDVGDRVTLRVGPGLNISDRLVEATLSWSNEGGVTAQPTVGEMTDNPDRTLAKALRASAARIRKIEVK